MIRAHHKIVGATLVVVFGSFFIITDDEIAQAVDLRVGRISDIIRSVGGVETVLKIALKGVEVGLLGLKTGREDGPNPTPWLSQSEVGGIVPNTKRCQKRSRFMA